MLEKTGKEEKESDKTLVLEECQKKIKKLHDFDHGIHCFCEDTGIQFFNEKCMSTLIITETCKKYCPYYQDLLKSKNY